MPEGIVYLDGNSLGPLPKATPLRLEKLLREQWGERLVRGWNPLSEGGEGWIDLPRRVGAKIAPLIGAAPDEVVACDSVSVNLFKLAAAALSMRRGRKVVLSEPGNFPTDLYMIQGLERLGLARQRLVPRDRIAEALDHEVAVLLLTHVHYRTGEMFDMIRLTRAAHEAGALVLWDLSHSCGAIPIDLEGARADFATGCGYKYLNGGPGAPAFAYVARRHHASLEQPLSGWMGHSRPFDFTDEYEPAPGIDRLLAGTPPIVGLAALESGVDLVAGAGVERLAAKSRALSEFFLECLAGLEVEIELVSPRDPSRRGSHLSFRHPRAQALSKALIERGVIGDFRTPDILRLGFAPAFLRFADIARAAHQFAQALACGEWRQPRFAGTSTVT